MSCKSTIAGAILAIAFPLSASATFDRSAPITVLSAPMVVQALSNSVVEIPYTLRADMRLGSLDVQAKPLTEGCATIQHGSDWTTFHDLRPGENVRGTVSLLAETDKPCTIEINISVADRVTLLTTTCIVEINPQQFDKLTSCH